MKRLSQYVREQCKRNPGFKAKLLQARKEARSAMTSSQRHPK